MFRQGLSVVLVLLAAPFGTAALSAPSMQDRSTPTTLVLPFRSFGVSDTTTLVSRELLVGDLKDLGVEIVLADSGQPPLPAGAEGCDDPGCAAELARQHGAARVIYGSLGRLGDKIIARLNVLDVGEAAPHYRDQLTATYVEDLDRVMRRFAEGIASGQPNSERASIESVTQAETLTPARRASRTGFGIRSGFLFPTAGSFGGADRLTDLRGVFRYELHDYQIETSTMLGFTWGESNFDWTIFDLHASRIFGMRDFSTYLGAGVGVHSVTVAQRKTEVYNSPYYPSYAYESVSKQTETAPTLDLVAGLLALRTYDFQVVAELRYHYVFDNFDDVGGGGAQGVMLTIGTSK